MTTTERQDETPVNTPRALRRALLDQLRKAARNSIAEPDMGEGSSRFRCAQCKQYLVLSEAELDEPTPLCFPCAHRNAMLLTDAVAEIERQADHITALVERANLASELPLALSVWTNDTDTVIAYDKLDVVRVICDHALVFEGNVDEWRMRELEDVVTISYVDDDPRRKDSKTCREWIAQHGRGFLCSTEY